MARLRLGVLVSGEGTNLQAILDAIAKGSLDAEVGVVLSNRSGVRALQRAEQAGVASECIPHGQFPSREDFDRRLVERLQAARAEWIVLAGFMRLLTPVFLEAFPSRILNIHPSLLPVFPGTKPIRDALDYGVKVTGCTVHLVDEGTDSGPIVGQQAVEVREGDDEVSLAARIHEAEHRLYVDTLIAISRGGLVLEHTAGGRYRASLRLSAS